MDSWIPTHLLFFLSTNQRCAACLIVCCSSVCVPRRDGLGNTTQFVWGNDREIVTFDDAGGAYLGMVEATSSRASVNALSLIHI